MGAWDTAHRLVEHGAALKSGNHIAGQTPEGPLKTQGRRQTKRNTHTRTNQQTHPHPDSFRDRLCLATEAAADNWGLDQIDKIPSNDLKYAPWTAHGLSGTPRPAGSV